MKKLFESTAFRLILAIVAGAVAGEILTAANDRWLEAALQTLMIIKHISSQVILFMVPLIIFGCVAPAISRFSGNVTSLLGFTLVLAYASSAGAAALSIGVSRFAVPLFGLPETSEALRPLPSEMLISLNFPTVDTMSTLLFALLVGLGTVWTDFKPMARFLEGFQRMVLTIVKRVLLPILPWFVGANFALIAYKGQLAEMRIFLPVVALIVACQLVWLVVLYLSASAFSRRNGWLVARCYPKAYFTALGTMSSAATLPFALECIGECRIVNRQTSDFALPLFSNIHLCGSVIAEMMLVTTVYFIMFGSLPPAGAMVAFALLACIIAIGSPGVPGGLNMSCMTIVTTMLLGDIPADLQAEFFGIMTAIYTVQDGFGTACNVTGDGALTLMTDRRASDIASAASPA